MPASNGPQAAGSDLRRLWHQISPDPSGERAILDLLPKRVLVCTATRDGTRDVVEAALAHVIGDRDSVPA
jgi:hypothetical protein